MTEHNTFPGSVYAVTCKDGCAVTDASGELNMYCEAGGQLHVTAPSDKLYTSADASVRKVNFKQALAALGLLGGGVKINLMKYAHCKTLADMVAVNPDYKNDLTADGAWIYPLPNMVSIPLNNGNWWFRGSPLRKIHIEMPRLRQGQYLWRSSKLEDARVSLPSLITDQRSMFEQCPLKSVRLNAPNLTVATGLFASVSTIEEVNEQIMQIGEVTEISYICFNMMSLKRFAYSVIYAVNAAYAFSTCPNFTTFESDLPKLKSATDMFKGCQLDKNSVLRVCNSLPTWTDGASHPITLGIHVNYKNDAEVLAAIDNATARGWTITTQWNGTPTSGVSTFGFKRVWVRKTQDAEYGRYLDANGTRWQVTWCDMLSAPDGSTPEDHGYELYRSVDAAVAYWELEPYVDPEREQLLTD